MSNQFLPFALPEIGEDEINEVVDALRSGWVTTGPKVKQFEQDFCAYLGGDLEAVAVNSATAGLHLALEAIGVGPGDEVILPTYTFTATAEVVRYLGAEAVMVDVDPGTLNLTPESVESAITSRTRAIMPVHFAGLACDMEQLLTLAGRQGIQVVEDAAHAFPTTYKGKLVGKLNSDASVFSFYANKTMTTGEGGMVVTSNAELAARCRTMRLHGINRDAFDRYVSKTPAWYYEVVAPGFKYNMTDIAAAIGIHQLRRIDAFRRKREEIAAYYREAFGDLPLLLPAAEKDGDIHAWHLFVVRLLKDAGMTRDEFIMRMSEKGIGCSVHFIPLHLQPYWRERYSLKPEMFPNAQAAYEQAVSLPLYTRMTQSDVERVVEAVRELLS